MDGLTGAARPAPESHGTRAALRGFLRLSRTIRVVHVALPAPARHRARFGVARSAPARQGAAPRGAASGRRLRIAPPSRCGRPRARGARGAARGRVQLPRSARPGARRGGLSRRPASAAVRRSPHRARVPRSSRSTPPWCPRACGWRFDSSPLATTVRPIQRLADVVSGGPRGAHRSLPLARRRWLQRVRLLFAAVVRCRFLEALSRTHRNVRGVFPLDPDAVRHACFTRSSLRARTCTARKSR